VEVRPGRVAGEIRAPASKSVMLRAVAAALLAEGETAIVNPSDCDDARAALGVARALGAAVTEGDDRALRIEGGLDPTGEALDCDESGLAARMFPAIAALSERELTLSGSGTLLGRPVEAIVEPLRQLGAFCETSWGRLPIRVRGPLQGGEARVDGTLRSQFLTGLLLALPLAPRDSRLDVRGLVSRPYIDLTLEVLGHFGIEVRQAGYEVFTVPGRQKYRAGTVFTVEGDWSGAAFPLVAGAVAGRVRVCGLRADSRQSDRAVLAALQAAGARLEITPDAVQASRGELRAFEFDAGECPDLFPPLVALAAHCLGTSRLQGADRLRHKESDRAAALVETFSRLGIGIVRRGDTLEVQGGPVSGGEVDPRQDHRLAMAAAVAALCAAAPVRIGQAGCVGKSYPGFFEDLRALGGIVHE